MGCKYIGLGAVFTHIYIYRGIFIGNQSPYIVFDSQCTLITIIKEIRAYSIEMERKTSQNYVCDPSLVIPIA